MKTIKHIGISPDVGGPLCTIFYEDGTKLAVTLPGFKIGQNQLNALDVIEALDSQLGLTMGGQLQLNGVYTTPFINAFNSVAAMPSTSKFKLPIPKANPWHTSTWNLTQQSRYLREDPALAIHLMDHAGVVPDPGKLERGLAQVGETMKALNVGYLLGLAGRNYPYPGEVFYRFFGYEVEGQPETAWQVKKEGPAKVFYTRNKNKDLQLRVEMPGFTDWVFARHDSTEDGFEFDGHGFVYFFRDAAHADAYVAARKERFRNEVASLTKLLKGTVVQ